jgi:putative hemolysin
MLLRARAKPPRPLTQLFRPQVIVGGLPGFLPKLRAFGGLRLPATLPQPTPETLGRIGSLEARLARTANEVRKAQKLRYHVFYEEMSAIADATTKLARRDIDPFDSICDHLFVLDHAAKTFKDNWKDSWKPGRKPAIVGTYRLLRQEVAERHGGFYSASEFDVGALIARHPTARFLELGRSCVLPPYRNKRTVELLWHGIWSYVLQHRMDVLIGCASLEGTDPDKLAQPLSFLHHFARAPEEWRAQALPRRYVEMNRMPKRAIDQKAALHALPPLIKGYLRLGASIGDGAVIDRQFGTTDVLIVLPVAAISARYIEHFGPGAERHAA